MPVTAYETCKDHDQPHSVMWMDREDHRGIPSVEHRDNQDDAIAFVRVLFRDHYSDLFFVKVFRSDNEGYCCYHWVTPLEAVQPKPVPAIVRKRGLRARTRERFAWLLGPYRVDDW